ncbi:hypothetical protein NQZ68_035224 [Dissostichus eleginoides]|nr:hypothetical protein NQZ68_035224 [Dissostichus eleginoides]
MAYKSSPVLQTVIIPTDPIPVRSTIRQCRGREGETERHRLSPLLASLRDVPGQKVNGVEDLKNT